MFDHWDVENFRNKKGCRSKFKFVSMNILVSQKLQLFNDNPGMPGKTGNVFFRLVASLLEKK